MLRSQPRMSAIVVSQAADAAKSWRGAPKGGSP